MAISNIYNIGISYACEDSDIVKQIVNALETVGLSVFFDQKEPAKLVGKNLTYTLPEIFTNECDYCLMFVSSSYAEKKWTSYERDWLLHKRLEVHKNNVYTDCIIPVFIEHIDLPGLNPDIVGFDVDKQSPEEIAAIMYEKVYGTKFYQSSNSISMHEVFQTIYTAIGAALEQQSDGTYKTDKRSDYDIIIRLYVYNHSYFVHLVLEEPTRTLLKISQGETYVSGLEWSWDAEAYMEEGQLYFINYNFTSELPGIPHSYTVRELSVLIVQRVCNLIKEHSYV